MDSLKNKRIKLIIFVIVLTISAITIFIFCMTGSARDIRKQLDLGNKYLMEENYSNAIATFNKVISIDPTCVDAYLGLVDAYVGEGDDKTALEIAKCGYEITCDDRLQNWIKILEDRINTEYINEDEIQIKTEKQPAKTDEIIKMTELLGCSTVNGVSWLEAGGVDGMRSLLPSLTAYDSYWEAEYGNTHIGCDLTGLSIENENNRFGYTEENGEISLTEVYVVGTEPPLYADGLCMLMSGYEYDIDKVVEALGVDADLLVEGNMVEYMSDLGPVRISFENTYNYKYEFYVHGEDVWDISLFDEDDGNGNKAIRLTIRKY